MCAENPAAACRVALVTLSGRASWRPQRVTAVRFRERRQKKKKKRAEGKKVAAKDRRIDIK